MGPIRDLSSRLLRTTNQLAEVSVEGDLPPPVETRHVKEALHSLQFEAPSVDDEQIRHYREWDDKFGSLSGC